ncbi:MAG: rRNA pseudouridine synthase, partial [Kiritimatiellae bacterium]|nr:rRNA pseudouridine synthase [Kiritimatiellia bacterium]
MAEERLQNILARAGVASRRGAAAIIESGRVTVDGIVVREAGARFDPESANVAIDGERISAAEKKRTIMLYKPVGVLSSMCDPFGGKTVADIIKGSIGERLVPVGRLDKDSE